ncbi:helix-turn-helix transcriptional regulator [Intestinimonas butyriciproducens]|uniref:helix-turn-helix transcriptional regulator n=1 Tax=Intestinimonas butyriciproducens TaxID=1297617 RepID=UPI0013ECC13D|nr:helix-turn-helix domain-containing protein [Intestinimonas butyriciproducens]MCR1907087.1 helix-turn-helix domain-containing protein [Intestinimonas butyriciproducens]
MQFTIKQARHFAGFTQAELAKRLGIARGTYIKIEKEPPRATIGQISKISALTGIPVGDIFLGCSSTFVDKSSSN